MRCGLVTLACLAAIPAAAADLPRLAGLVITPGERVALFDTGAGVMTRAEVGDDVEGYRVRSIDRAGVRLEREGQMALLSTSPASASVTPADEGGATFGLVLRRQPPPDD